MNLDHARLQSILDTPAWFYDAGQAPVRIDARLHPGARTFIGTMLDPAMQILDVGCGDGTTLLTYHDRVQRGVGIDHDPAHIARAQHAQHARQITNIEFYLLDLCRLDTIAAPETFDVIISQRGPLEPRPEPLMYALHMLRPNGVLFCEVIGELHHREARALFPPTQRMPQFTTTSDQLRVACEQAGLHMRLAADLVSKRYYPDVYAWLQFQCAVWRWLGEPLPAADDPRIGWFAERHRIHTGEIETTHHVVWGAGVKGGGPEQRS